MNWAFPRIVKASLKVRPVGLQGVSRIGSAASIGRVVSASVVVEVLAPGTTTVRARALVVKWCRDSTSCSRPAGGRGRVRAEGLTIVNPKTLMEHKNPALTALEVAGRDLLRHTQEFGLTPAAELNLGKPPRPDAGDHDPFGA